MDKPVHHRSLRAHLDALRTLGAAGVKSKIKGRILPVTSQHRDTARNLPHYSASKAGMTVVMKELAHVLAPDGMRVNVIAPGAIPGQRRRRQYR
jgi:NAD(P)-dependent dehydrogenase (short-subunit alcohol dehydrogenase family)